MKSIWLSGPSGTGKSTLIEKISPRYNLPIRKEVTRANDTILNYDLATRQLYFGLTYVNRHMASQNESFISDRTILDYIFWTFYDGRHDDGGIQHIMDEFVEVIKGWFVPGDVVVVPPFPEYTDFCDQIFSNFLTDQLRYAIYIGKHHDIYGYTPYNEVEFASFLYNMSKAMFMVIQRTFKHHSGELGIAVLTPKSTSENYWSWQDAAVEQLDDIFKDG